MVEPLGNHPLRSPVGAVTLASWTIYVLIGMVHLPSTPPWALITSFFGIVACLAVALNVRYWLLTVLLASSVYLCFYTVRVIHWAAKLADADKTSFISGLSFYYSASWGLVAHAFQHKGILHGLMQFFLDVLMPLISLALIVAALRSRRSRPKVPRAG